MVVMFGKLAGAENGRHLGFFHFRGHRCDAVPNLHGFENIRNDGLILLGHDIGKGDAFEVRHLITRNSLCRT